MTNPPYILDHLEAIAKIMNSDRVYKFLHVPIQSGSDVVLGDMKREYTADDFSRVVNVLRQKVPGITIGKLKGPIIYFFDGRSPARQKQTVSKFASALLERIHKVL